MPDDMDRYYTATGPSGIVREYVHVRLTVPLPSVAHPRPYARPGGVVTSGWYERIGPTHPETLFAVGFRGLDFAGPARE